MQKSVPICYVGLLAITSAVCGATAKIDVSQIIDQSTAESALETKVKPAAPQQIEGGEGYYSKCNYYSLTPGKTLVLRFFQAGEKGNVQKELEAMTKNTPALKEISGLGDKAMVTDGKASALPSGAMMLYVVKGNALITVGITGFEDESLSLLKAKGVAEKILAQL